MEEIRIVREGAIPLHVQLLNQLRHFVLSGKWAPDARIPSEPELHRQLNISRSTIRQALSNAEAEGLITRVPGKGTFVAAAAPGRRSSHLVGYITDDCWSRMQSQVLTGIDSVGSAAGFRVIFGNSNANLHDEDRLLDQLVLEDKVAGIVVWPALRDGSSGRLMELAGQIRTPVVVVDRTLADLACDFVTSDNYAGAYAAGQHLTELGHRDVVFLSRPTLHLSTVAERWRGYQDAMKAAGATPREPLLVGTAGQEMNTRSVLGDDDHAQCRDCEEIARYLDTHEHPTAFLAVNDLMALQALKAARMVGLQVPEELSIVGFDDDLVINSLLDVPMTTVAQDAQQIGRRAAELLLDRIQGYDGAPREERLPAPLKVRASTAPPTPLKVRASTAPAD